MRPSVDFPAPRNPISAIRPQSRPSSAGAAKCASSSARASPSRSGGRRRKSSTIRPNSAGSARLAAEQPGKRQVERVADPAQQFDREIALPAFELREITLRQTGIARQNPARHAAAGAFLAHPLAEAAEIIVPLGGGLRKAASAA